MRKQEGRGCALGARRSVRRRLARVERSVSAEGGMDRSHLHRRAMGMRACPLLGELHSGGPLAGEGPLEGEAHLRRAREAELGARRHRAVHEPCDLARHVRDDMHERRHLAPLDLRRDRPRVLARDRAPAGDHLVEHHPDGVDVAPRVGLVRGVRLLRRHVLGGPHEDARHGQAPLSLAPIWGSVRAELGDTEIDELQDGLRGLVGDEDVLRLEVAVRDAERVRGLERVEDLAAARSRHA